MHYALVCCYAVFLAGKSFEQQLWKALTFCVALIVANAEYILANAACIRGFTPYFAMLTNEPPSRYLTAFAGYELDW